MPRCIVLYVEDEEFDAFFMQRAFTQPGTDLDLRIVTDGREAINYLSGSAPYGDRHQHPFPSLVLLDLNLPLVSGFQVLEWMRGAPELKSLPVVVFSSSARPEDKIKASQLGAVEYLSKPGSGMEFPSIVQTLRQKWLGASPAPRA